MARLLADGSVLCEVELDVLPQEAPTGTAERVLLAVPPRVVPVLARQGDVRVELDGGGSRRMNLLDAQAVPAFGDDVVVVLAELT